MLKYPHLPVWAPGFVCSKPGILKEGNFPSLAIHVMSLNQHAIVLDSVYTKRAVLCWKEGTILTFLEQHYPDTWCPQLTILQRHTCIMLKKCAIFKCPLIWWSQTYENSCKMETLDWAESLGETQSEVKGRERSKDRKTFRSWKRAASITKVNLIWSKTVKGN